MVTQLLFKCILIDGSILTAIVSPILVLALCINPRMALSDYPQERLIMKLAQHAKPVQRPVHLT